MDTKDNLSNGDQHSATKNRFPPQSGDVIHGYRLENKLKSSSNCVVFVCHHISDESKKYVTKIGIKMESNRLENEYKCYELLAGVSGVPQMIFYQTWTVCEREWYEIDWAMIVIQKLKSTRKTCSAYTDKTLTLDQLRPIAVQQIELLKVIHSKGLLHKGVKPDNFVMSEDGKQVFIIDFNCSEAYVDSNENHIQYNKAEGKRVRGLPLFHSCYYHNGIRRSRRDDLESLGYCWVYLLKGCLPWSQIKREGDKWTKYVTDIGKCKNETTVEELCKGLPKGFEKYFEICRHLGFKEDPNYDQMKECIENSFND